jgi:hypothetical protein
MEEDAMKSPSELAGALDHSKAGFFHSDRENRLQVCFDRLSNKKSFFDIALISK